MWNYIFPVTVIKKLKLIVQSMTGIVWRWFINCFVDFFSWHRIVASTKHANFLRGWGVECSVKTKHLKKYWYMKLNWWRWVLEKISRGEIYVTCWLGGPYSEKLWPRSWKCGPGHSLRSQFFTIQTDPKLVNKIYLFFSKISDEENSGRHYCDRGQR